LRERKKEKTSCGILSPDGLKEEGKSWSSIRGGKRRLSISLDDHLGKKEKEKREGGPIDSCQGGELRRKKFSDGESVFFL